MCEYLFCNKNLSDSGIHSSSQRSVNWDRKTSTKWMMPRHSIVDWLACVYIKNGKLVQCREKWEERQKQRREQTFKEPIFLNTDDFRNEYRKFTLLHTKLEVAN